MSTNKHYSTVTNFGGVWFNTKYLANILSMAAIRKVCRITMDTSVEARPSKRRNHHEIHGIQVWPILLWCRNLTTCSSTTPPHPTPCKTEGANRAQALYKKIGRPSEKDFTGILENNLIQNCPVTPDDARRAITIYGLDVTTLKGKRVKKQNRSIPIIKLSKSLPGLSHITEACAFS